MPHEEPASLSICEPVLPNALTLTGAEGLCAHHIAVTAYAPFTCADFILVPRR